MEEQIGYILIYCRLLLGMGLITFVFSVGAFVGMVTESKDKQYNDKADEGLVFCKLGENYVWLTPQEFERLRMTERSE
ncbi:MAG: hypothetical protein PHN75_16965 [Syntrophales bacterium]|nr:hypothetical protein [Syntrophales bacterium]